MGIGTGLIHFLWESTRFDTGYKDSCVTVASNLGRAYVTIERLFVFRGLRGD